MLKFLNFFNFISVLLNFHWPWNYIYSAISISCIASTELSSTLSLLTTSASTKSSFSDIISSYSGTKFFGTISELPVVQEYARKEVAHPRLHHVVVAQWIAQICPCLQEVSPWLVELSWLLVEEEVSTRFLVAEDVTWLKAQPLEFLELLKFSLELRRDAELKIENQNVQQQYQLGYWRLVDLSQFLLLLRFDRGWQYQIVIIFT